MPKFSANLSLMFYECTDMPDRISAAAQAGFSAVEMQFPYAWKASELSARLQSTGLALVLHNLPAGDWQAGDRGLACLPQRVDEFRHGIDTALGYATTLGVRQLNCLAGVRPAELKESVARTTLLNNLALAADALQSEGIRLLIEPINTFDIPGFFVSTAAQAIELLDELQHPNACLQFDIYHAQRMHGELAGHLQRLLPRIAHIQLADNPGRHEPGTGEINYAFLLPFLDRIGYTGWVGCEYIPQAGTLAGLSWMQGYTA